MWPSRARVTACCTENTNGKRIYIFFVNQNSGFLLLYIMFLKYPMSASIKYKILSNITILQTVTIKEKKL